MLSENVEPQAVEGPKEPEPSQPTVAPPSPATEPLDGPVWATGKTRAQLINEMEEFYTALPHLDLSGQVPAVAPAALPGPAPVVESSVAPTLAQALPPDPALAQTDPEEWRRQFDAYNRATTQAILREAASEYSRPLMESQAQTARELSRRDGKNTDIWERYGHEIDREMAKAPMGQRTQANYSMLCDMVRGRHFDELVGAAAPTNPTATATLTDTPSGVEAAEESPLDSLFASDNFYARRLRDSGLSKAAVRRNLVKMRLSEKQWVDNVLSGQVVITEHGEKQIMSGGGVGE